MSLLDFTTSSDGGGSVFVEDRGECHNQFSKKFGRITNMKNFHKSFRIFIGLLFVIISFSKFGFLPSAVNMPQVFTPEGWAFISAIAANGYLFPAIGIVLLISGLAFIFNRYVALAAVILMPITVNFALFHIFLGFREFSLREAVSYIPLVLNLYIIYRERKKYAMLLKS